VEQTMSVKLRERIWSDFSAWCRARGLRMLPAHPWTVAAYARWCESRHHYPAIVARIKVISRAHLLACATPPDRHPTVTRTLRTIEVRNRTRASRAALYNADEEAPTSPPTAKPGNRRLRDRHRDRALRISPRLVSRRPKGS
jgi:hypothetical protein